MSANLNKIGVLLINLGTPEKPTSKAIRKYLAEFLSDPLVVRLPRFLWLIILYSLILPFRPNQIKKFYEKIWAKEGSPLLVYSNQLTKKLQQKLGTGYQIELAMRYGNPNIKNELIKLNHCSSILVIPLFPQYSSTTTQSIIAKVSTLSKKLAILNLHCLNSYATHPLYISALADSLHQYWQRKGRAKKLLISFHGIPVKYLQQGDPYLAECEATVNALVKALSLTETDYQLCFQSRFGRTKWLAPYLDKVLIDLAQAGITEVDVICPGFAVDCLETLEEIDSRYKKLYLKSGGKSLHYIPALNANEEQINLFYDIVKSINKN
ncbi:MAG: ferrochelatase [Gammaproteobacteria bacterium RIFCSPHIGHO2_12_FULL_35_23]|nr:MAG: ferrochelatase [Gammaproteobacteria bacterium RIFCSPHIGHO2_12_FULL_35_23]